MQHIQQDFDPVDVVSASNVEMLNSNISGEGVRGSMWH